MKKKILIVDDDPSILEVVTLILEERGYDVFVDDGRTAEEVALKYEPDVIILDIRLRETNGIEIAKRLKKKKALQTTPIIMMTAHYDIENQTKKAGAEDYIKKPFDIEYLEKVVAKYV